MLKESDRHVAAVSAAAALLNCFEHDEALRLRDLCALTGLQKSRVLRLAGSLEAAGLLASTDEGYRLGPKLMALGRIVNERYEDLILHVQPLLAKLRTMTGATAFLSVVRGTHRVVLAREMPRDGIFFTISQGQPRPLHAGATGHALLAFSSTLLQERVLAGPLPALTPSTVTEPTKLAAHLAIVRAQGYAISKGQATPELLAVAAPLQSRTDELLGAITLARPMSQTTSETHQELSRLLCKEIKTFQKSASHP